MAKQIVSRAEAGSVEPQVKAAARPTQRRVSRTHHECDVHAERGGFERIALVLQGGGALGSYQAGVYQALAEGGVAPNWIAGISIGAINSAIIAGNPPEKRVDRLREFWEVVTTDLAGTRFEAPQLDQFDGEFTRSFFTRASSFLTLLHGQAGFFRPRFPPPWAMQPGSAASMSYYDTGELKSTLERLVDFDRLNRDHTRLSLGAVNVRTGNFVYFDNATHVIRPEHVMASGALPPGFPPIEINGEYYWDGGLVSNTPLTWVVDTTERANSLVFQVDLWSSRGELPRDVFEVNSRQKDIQYSSRTRMVTDLLKQRANVDRKIAALLAKLPPELLKSDEAQALLPHCETKTLNIVHLIYRAKQYETEAKDYEFSRRTMREHWQAGYNDAVRTLRHRKIFEQPDPDQSIQTFDIATEASD